MRLSRFGGKEIINLSDGTKLGLLEDADLLIDENTGKIEAFLINSGGKLSFRAAEKSNIRIPWENIRKIGSDIIVVEFNKNSRYNS